MQTKPAALIATLALFGLLTGCSSNKKDLPELTPAQENKATIRFLEKYDLDRDGKITCKDANKKRSALFTKVDKDENEQLDAGEYRFAKFEDPAFRFIELSDVDTDQSLTISKAEFIAVPNSDYLALDRDKNCLVSRDEILIAARTDLEKRFLRGSGLGRREQRDTAEDTIKDTTIEEIEPIDDIDPQPSEKNSE